MTLLYDRKYELTIGLPSRTEFTPLDKQDPVREGFSPTIWQPASDFIETTTLDAVEITDLQMTANIKGTSNESNSAASVNIQIFNMATDTRNIVERTNNYVILKAGYAQDPELKVVFVGQVKDAYSQRQGQNLVTTLSCGEGYSPNNSVKVSNSIPAGSTYADVLNYLIGIYSANGIPLGDFVDDWSSATDYNNRVVSQGGAAGVIVAEANPQNYVQLPVMKNKPANQPLINGMSLSGYLHQNMKKVCDQIGYVSYITNGRLFVHPKGFTKTIEQFEFSSDQMKSIRRTSSQSTNGSLGKGISGIQLTTFLDGRLDIDKRIAITDGDFKGEYKIITKEHIMDYENGQWDTVLTCQEDTT